MDSSQENPHDPNIEERAARPPDYTAPGRPPSGMTAQGPPWHPRESHWERTRHKSPFLAAMLSLMPGLGQVYVGYYRQGFINILVVASLIALLAADPRGLEPLLGLFLAFFWLYNIVDAARRASFYNQALAGQSPLDLPKDMSLPGGQGSLVGGALLILVGVLALAHTAFNLSLRWLQDWWPLVLVLVGVYLVAQEILQRKKKSRARPDSREDA